VQGKTSAPRPPFTRTEELGYRDFVRSKRDLGLIVLAFESSIRSLAAGHIPIAESSPRRDNRMAQRFNVGIELMSFSASPEGGGRWAWASYRFNNRKKELVADGGNAALLLPSVFGMSCQFGDERDRDC